MRLLPAAALLLASAMPLSSAAAQSGGEDRARLHFQAGASYYEAGDYEDALREFRRSYELSERPELFYNISLCYQQLDDLEQAASYLERYLAAVPDIPNRPNLERRLEHYRTRLASQAETNGADANTSTNSDASTNNDASTNESASEAEGAADGSDSSADRDDLADRTREEDPPSGRGANVPAILGFALAGAGAVMFGVSGGLALAKRSELDDAGCRPNCSSSDVRSLKLRAAFADVGLGLTVAGAALGVIFLVVRGGHDDDTEARRLRVEPYAGPRSAGASLRVTF